MLEENHDRAGKKKPFHFPVLMTVVFAYYPSMYIFSILSFHLLHNSSVFSEPDSDLWGLLYYKAPLFPSGPRGVFVSVSFSHD